MLKPLPDEASSVEQIQHLIASFFICLDVVAAAGLGSRVKSFGVESDRRAADDCNVGVLNLIADGPREPCELQDSLDGNRLLILT
mmetsp:Transcript_124353/g.194831  ORF Transcript_124353/g.194831 Transcript_124353/m.194831 type:complete len:85 (+) Transcript_124353:657-911(+)